MGLYFYYGKGKENRKLGTGFLVQHRIVSAVNRVVYVSEKMSCIINSEMSLV
jgi:hypothetical protein